MKRFFKLAAIFGCAFLLGGGFSGTSILSTNASGQGIGQSDSYYPSYQSYYPRPAYPVQVRPSGYAYGYTYTSPYTYYPATPRYHSRYGYYNRYPSQVIRRYRVTPNRSGSPFGSAHSSQYFGNPHASQYLGR